VEHHEITGTLGADLEMETLDLCRTALAGIGAPAVHTERLAAIAGKLRAIVEETTAAIDEVLVSAVTDPIMHQLEVRSAVLALAATLEPDEQYDPADDPRPEQAHARLAALLGSNERARGVSEALHLLRYPPQPGGDEESGGPGPVLAA
jgi:hypothetical protein